MNLSIIIPLYNEAGVITRTLDRLQELTFPPFVEHTEVVIVDDCSSDESARLAGEYTTGAFRITLIRLSSNRGKGAAVTAGIKAAKGDTILVQDADLELDPADIPPMLERMHSGNLDLVSGTRFSPRRRYPSHALPATIANRFFSSAASLITGIEDHRYNLRLQAVHQVARRRARPEGREVRLRDRTDDEGVEDAGDKILGAPCIILS